MLQYIVLTLLA